MPTDADRERPGHDDEAPAPHPAAGPSCPDADTHPPARIRPLIPGQDAEPFRPGELLDATLTAALGPVDDVTGDAIAGICNDALHAVLGPAIVGALRADRRRLPLATPWVLDLARGLQFQSHQGTPEPGTASLLIRLGGPQITAADARRLADTADLAAALAQGRVLEQVLGPGAGGRDPRANEVAAPWLGGLKLGSRIYLVQELLRLLPPTGTADRS